MAITEKFVGRSVLRKEDASLLTGQGSFVDNLTLPGMLHLAVVRSPFAHARVVKVDVSKALEMPGVVGAWSGADLAGEWAGPLPMVWPITEDIKTSDHWPITKDKARFQGDGVAVLVAESRGLADDAAEVVAVEYEQLTPVLDLEEAAKDGSPLVHDELGTNAVVHWSHGGGGDQSVFDTAPVQLRLRYEAPRITPSPIETRGALASVVPAMGEFTLWTSTQIPHIARVTLSGTTGIPEHKLRIVAPDVGGAFGAKLNVYAEEALAVALAKRLGRPVKWTEERAENYVATIHGRDVVHELTFAATRDGRIVAVKSVATCAMGAYLQLVTPGVPLLGAWIYSGPYAIPNYSVTFTGVFTHTTPTDAYRGAGRPEATYVLERTMDALAAELGIDPLELRRRNFVTEFPHTMASGLTIDAGDYEACLDKLLERLDLDAIRADQAARRDRGDVKQVGVGFSTYNEMCGLAPSRILGAIRYAVGGWDAATIRFQPLGTVQVVTGTSPHGQSHETTWAQIAADQLGVSVDDVEVLHGDTAVSQLGMDTYGSRSLTVGGIALYHASQKVIAKARRIVAHQLEVAEDDLEFADGTFTVRGSPDRSMGIQAVAFQAHAAHNLPDGMEPGLEETAVFDPPNFSWPAGAHAAVVEVDTETGDTRLLRYVAVDDVGNPVNPQIIDGQVHGGITQGIAAALFEEGAYDADGNMLTTTMTTYLVPSAAELPSFETDRTETVADNPLGVKGVGETGTIAAAPAVINAVVDALSHLGVTDVPLPATPERVWKAIEEVAS